MKKLLVIVVLGLLWCNVSYSYQYCYKGFNTTQPIKNASFMNVTLLKLELECLNKNKEAEIFEKKTMEMFKKVVQEQTKLLYEKGESANKEVEILQQNYVNTAIQLFMKLK